MTPAQHATAANDLLSQATTEGGPGDYYNRAGELRRRAELHAILASTPGNGAHYAEAQLLLDQITARLQGLSGPEAPGASRGAPGASGLTLVSRGCPGRPITAAWGACTPPRGGSKDWGDLQFTLCTGLGISG